MKKRRSLLFFAALFLSIALSSCSKPPSPHDALQKYTKLWTDERFEDMYAMLSKKAKENISKEEFVKRYKKIYQDIEATNLSVTPLPVKEKEEDSDKDQMKLPFSVKMDTIAGPIQFKHEALLVKEKGQDQEQWRVQWDTTYIFPQLQKNDKVRIAITPGKRGEIYDRNGLPLAVNGTAYEIGIVPGKMGESEEAIKKQLSDLLHIPVEFINEKLNADWVQPDYFVPIQKVAKSETALLEKRSQHSSCGSKRSIRKGISIRGGRRPSDWIYRQYYGRRTTKIQRQRLFAIRPHRKTRARGAV